MAVKRKEAYLIIPKKFFEIYTIYQRDEMQYDLREHEVYKHMLV